MLVATLLVFVAGVLVGLFISQRSTENGLFAEHRETNAYRYVSPLLACGENLFDHVGQDEVNTLEDTLKAMIEKKKRAGFISDASVYVRQLRGGPWIGVNYDAEFVPGSLLKVPLVMSLYKLSEQNPQMLLGEVFYESGSVPARQHFGNNMVTPGQSYTVKELVEYSLAESDNHAAVLLSEVVGSEALIDAYRTLGVETPGTFSDYVMTVRAYAAFFRILYNATYNTPEDSEEILETLTKSTFTEGIVAGIPEGIPVAHKFGERDIGGSQYVQLHDCGIVYHPERPYLLCIMMRGSDFDALARFIAEVSKAVYESIQRDTI
jgi:beta-lactamase class A